jgi:hypothetical protein
MWVGTEEANQVPPADSNFVYDWLTIGSAILCVSWLPIFKKPTPSSFSVQRLNDSREQNNEQRFISYSPEEDQSHRDSSCQ